MTYLFPFAHAPPTIARYLAMLEQEGIQKSIYDEVEALQRLRFDYRDKMVRCRLGVG